MELFSLAWWGTIIGGLGIFLMCITFLGEGLKKLAGNKLKTIIDKFTQTPLKGILVGMCVTVVIQSSSATTALTIGLIAAGLMSFKQAVGVIMGANIGTTVTSFLIGLNVAEYAPFFLLIGAFLFLISNKQKIHYIGITLFGFGGLFFGLTLMETCLTSLAALPEFNTIIERFGSNPFLGVLVGMVGTICIQSSSAFIGVLQSLFEAANSASSSGVFTLAVCIPILFGSNLGTTITAILASLGGGTAAKRAAGFHVLFNLLGTILFMLLLKQYTTLVVFIANSLHLDPKMQIAVAHILFNILTTLILFPFTNILVKAVTKLIKEQKQLVPELDLSVLDQNIIDIMPIKALDIAYNEACKMGDMLMLSQDYLLHYLNKNDTKYKDGVLKIEDNIDIFNNKLNAFLNKIEQSELGNDELKMYTSLLKIFSDIERISDHHENLVEYFEKAYELKEKISDFERESITHLLNQAELMTQTVINAFKDRSINVYNEVLRQEEEMDEITRQTKEDYFNLAVNRVEKRTYFDMVFVDVASNIERIGDHCMNIAEELE